MSDEIPIVEVVKIDLAQWVDKAKADPAAYLERRATEVLLTALNYAKPFGHKIFLKGGILMGVVYESPRQTGDIDFTAIMDPDVGVAEELKEQLDKVFPRAAAASGNPALLCNVQSFKYFPKGEKFPKNDGPAIKLKIAYAIRGSAEQKHYNQGRCTNVLEIDISFKEPVGAIQIVKILENGNTIAAYSLLDLMAEKIRALLQQEKRNRNRRQDIYDLDALIAKFPLSDIEKKELLDLLHKKSKARDIIPVLDSLEQPEIIRRAKEDWETLSMEIGEVPDFNMCFEKVNEFYKSLPWK